MQQYKTFMITKLDLQSAIDYFTGRRYPLHVTPVLDNWDFLAGGRAKHTLGNF